MLPTGMELTRDYLNKFDTTAYLLAHFTDVKGEETDGNLGATRLRFFHEAFEEHSIKGKRLLDVGTGPNIYSTISACPHVDNIFLSDYVPQNREALSRWLNGTLDHSFENIFRWVVEKEGKREPEKRERDLRSKVMGVLTVDVRQENPLGPSIFPQFDVITTSLALDAAAADEEEYEQVCGNTSTLLKKNGHIVLVGALGSNYYTVGDTKFSVFSFNANMVKGIWIKLGYEILSWKEEQRSNTNHVKSNFGSFFRMVAKKLKD